MRSVDSLPPRVMVLAALLVAPAACSEDPVTPQPGFVVTGTVTNSKGAQIPAGARVLVAWEVSATSPDYGYIFGEGELEDGGTTFRVELDEAPPDTALNNGVLGVGIIFVTTDQTIGTGDVLEDISEAAVIGAAGQYGVIYVDPDGSLAESPPWVEAFSEGYRVGRGVDVADDFDEFSPVGPDEVEIILDDLDAIEFVNWT